MQQNEAGETVDANPFNRFIFTVIGNIKKNFSDQPEKLAAMYTELHNALSKEFGDTVKDHLNAEVKKLPAPDPKDQISDERKTELATQRTKLVNIFKLQQEMLKYYETELPSDIEIPSARKGAIGGRGDKLTRSYAFYVGDSVENLKHRTVKVDDKRSEVTLGNIASTVGKAAFVNTKALKDYIVEQLGVTPKDGKVDLGSEWTVTLPQAAGGKVLRGVAIGSDNAVVDENDDGDDDEDDDDENGTSETQTEEPTEDMFS